MLNRIYIKQLLMHPFRDKLKVKLVLEIFWQEVKKVLIQA